MPALLSRSRLHLALVLPALLLPALLLAAVLLVLGPEGARAQGRSVAGGTGAPVPQDSISFEEAVRLALERNYRVRLAQNDVQSSSVSVASNRAEYLPDLSFSSSGRRNYGRSFSQQEGGIVNQTSSSASFGVSSGINVFDGFNKDATLDQAQAQVQASSRMLRRRRQDVVFDVVSRYIELGQNRDLVRVREENLTLRQEQLSQTQAQIEVGEKPPSDVYQIRADVAEAEQQLLQAQRNVETTETNLARLLVLDPFADHDFAVGAVESVAETELDVQEYDLDRLIDTAFEGRADLEAQLASIEASEQGVRAARSSYWPSLNLSGNYGTNASSVARSLPGQEGTPGFFDQLNNRRGGGFSVQLSFPIFNRFQTRYNVEQQQVQLENVRFQREQLRQDIAVDVRQAYLDYQNAQKALDVTERRLEAAQRAQEAAQERYRLGAANYVELAQANTDLAEARSARVQARYDFLLQKKQIEYALGALDPEAPLLR